jgi:thymidylate synthase (FAD)
LVQKDYDLLRKIEEHYNWCLSIGRLPQQARYFLPNGLKTEIIMTYNIREWRHFFTLRCSKAAHPQMQALALSMLKGFHAAIPVLFEDLAEQYL